MLNSDYIGRFAPSPSGPLHFGSLIAALASYLQAKKNNGQWLVRIEDVDLPRSMTGADKIILETLESLGLYWDQSVVYQSQRESRYQEIITSLDRKGYIYPCTCTRKEIGKGPYSGKCRDGISNDKKTTALRIKVDRQTISFIDKVQGNFSQEVDKKVGDFIIKRADHMTSYNLAVVIDDADQNITDIVRGADLIDTTPRQIYLQQILGFQQPTYLHVPVATNTLGNKLSKQSYAPEINVTNTVTLIHDTLNFLGQTPPKETLEASKEEIIQWGINNWNLAKIPVKQNIVCERYA